MTKFASDVDAANALAAGYKKLKTEISHIVIGQEEVVKQVLTGIFCQGHSLLVGVPGLAKTLLVQTIATSLDLQFKRIQFTPDLMPSDIIGAETMDKERNFNFVKGPIFANIVLADEINRTPPKTQAALLEAMQEYTVTASGRSYPLERPFFVLATQNPIELEGTYPLPEAQLDRFLFNVVLDYLNADDELKVVSDNTSRVDPPVIDACTTAAEIIRFQWLVRQVPMSEEVGRKAVALVRATRPSDPSSGENVRKYARYGASIRATQFLALAAKARALSAGRYHVMEEDLRALALPVLRHRMLTNYQAESDGMTVDAMLTGI